jgi:GntR family transcriptional regulator
MEPSKRAGPETYALEDTLPTKRFATRPLYLQVRDAIAQRIVSGEWKPNRIIPNESELARQFGVSSGTMRKALDLAESEHLLTRRQGWGTSVNDQSSGEQAARYSNIRNRDGKRIVGNVEVLEILETTANERDGTRLRRRTQERVHRIRRVWSVQGKPYMVEDVVMPAKMFPGPRDTGRRIPAPGRIGAAIRRSARRRRGAHHSQQCGARCRRGVAGRSRDDRHAA